jgi:hypothetical protein
MPLTNATSFERQVGVMQLTIKKIYSVALPWNNERSCMKRAERTRARREKQFFSIVDIEIQTAIFRSLLLRRAYELIRKTFPLPLGTYARIGRSAD